MNMYIFFTFLLLLNCIDSKCNFSFDKEQTIVPLVLNCIGSRANFSLSKLKECVKEYSLNTIEIYQANQATNIYIKSIPLELEYMRNPDTRAFVLKTFYLCLFPLVFYFFFVIFIDFFI